MPETPTQFQLPELQEDESWVCTYPLCWFCQEHRSEKELNYAIRRVFKPWLELRFRDLRTVRYPYFRK